MNLDPKMVKELILIYADLDQENRKKLIADAYMLRLKQNYKSQLQKENVQIYGHKQMEKEVNERAGRRASELLDFMKCFDRANETEQAALFMLVNQLAGNANMVQESDINITIKEKTLSMKEYLDMYSTSVDYDKAREIVKNLKK